MIVADSSPLIVLGKVGKLELLRRCFKCIVIPKGVYEEITKKKGSPEVIALEQACKEGWVSVEKTAINTMLDTQNISKGEKEAISLAIKYKSIVILDDDSAKQYAAVLGVESHGTLYVLYVCCAKKILNKKDAIKVLDEMMHNGFYISHDIYLRFVELLDSIQNKKL